LELVAWRARKSARGGAPVTASRGMRQRGFLE